MYWFFDSELTEIVSKQSNSLLLFNIVKQIIKKIYLGSIKYLVYYTIFVINSTNEIKVMDLNYSIIHYTLKNYEKKEDFEVIFA